MPHQGLRHWRSASVNKGQHFGRSDEELPWLKLPLAVSVADVAPAIRLRSDDPTDRNAQRAPGSQTRGETLANEKCLNSISGPCRSNDRRKDPTMSVRAYWYPGAPFIPHYTAFVCSWASANAARALRIRFRATPRSPGSRRRTSKSLMA